MLGIRVWAFVEPAILKRAFEKLTLPLAKQGSSARFGLLYFSMTDIREIRTRVSAFSK